MTDQPMNQSANYYVHTCRHCQLATKHPLDRIHPENPVCDACGKSEYEKCPIANCNDLGKISMDMTNDQTGELISQFYVCGYHRVILLNFQSLVNQFKKLKQQVQRHNCRHGKWQYRCKTKKCGKCAKVVRL